MNITWPISMLAPPTLHSCWFHSFLLFHADGKWLYHSTSFHFIWIICHLTSFLTNVLCRMLTIRVVGALAVAIFSSSEQVAHVCCVYIKKRFERNWNIQFWYTLPWSSLLYHLVCLSNAWEGREKKCINNALFGAVVICLYFMCFPTRFLCRWSSRRFWF